MPSESEALQQVPTGSEGILTFQQDMTSHVMRTSLVSYPIPTGLPTSSKAILTFLHVTISQLPTNLPLITSDRVVRFTSINTFAPLEINDSVDHLLLQYRRHSWCGSCHYESPNPVLNPA